MEQPWSSSKGAAPAPTTGHKLVAAPTFGTPPQTPWLGDEDSNLGVQIQSLLSYR